LGYLEEAPFRTVGSHSSHHACGFVGGHEFGYTSAVARPSRTRHDCYFGTHRRCNSGSTGRLVANGAPLASTPANRHLMFMPERRYGGARRAELDEVGLRIREATQGRIRFLDAALGRNPFLI
jgi:hypothetical protein